jgi:PAS domain S-box-containing protein
VKDKTIKRVLLFFFLISAILAGVALETVRNLNRSAASSDWVNHTHATILAVDGVLGAVNATEATMRAFAMTGDARDRVACKEAITGIEENLEVAKALTRAEPAQHAEVTQLEALATARADFTRKILTARQSGQLGVVQSLFEADAGEGPKEIQRLVGKLKTEEMGLLAERDTVSYQQALTTRWTIWSGVALDVILLTGVAWLIRDALATRQRLAVSLQEANRQLDGKVQERTADLAAANERLTVENLERRWSNQALDHQLRYNQLIVNSINDSVFVVTKALNISRINPAVVDLTGRQPEELINEPISKVVRWLETGKPTEGSLLDGMSRALREGRDLRDQPAVVTDGLGRQRNVRLTLFPLRDRDKVVGGVVILQPTTSTQLDQS